MTVLLNEEVNLLRSIHKVDHERMCGSSIFSYFEAKLLENIEKY